MASGAILSGLLTTEKWDSERYKNPRREIFRQYPNGGMALTGILSMLDSEPTNDPRFSIYEERTKQFQTKTAAANADGPFTATGGNVNKTTAGFSETAGTVIRVKVVDTSLFIPDMNVKIFDVSTTTTPTTITGIIQSIVDSTKMEILLTSDYSNILNTTANNGLYVEFIGTAVKEGSDTNNPNPFIEPVENWNLTQIFRSSIQFTNTALVTDLKYDKSGPYKKQFLDGSLKHFIGMEDAFLWGERNSYSSGNVLIRETGGIVYFLKQWELGTVYKNSATAITSVDDDQKRIIDIGDMNNGKLTETVMDTLMERIFRTSTNTSNEKFVCCGSGFMIYLNQLYRSKVNMLQDQPKKDTYGMKIVTLTGPFGDLHFYTHPRFNQNERLRNSALIVDFDCLQYVPMKGRDTKFQDRVQPKKADYREDQWITEAGLRVMFPENMMWIYGVDGYEA